MKLDKATESLFYVVPEFEKLIGKERKIPGSQTRIKAKSETRTAMK